MTADRHLQLAPDPTGDAERLLTAKDVAEILNIRPKRVYELSIPAVRISDRQLRWRKETLERWIREREAVA